MCVCVYTHTFTSFIINKKILLPGETTGSSTFEFPMWCNDKQFKIYESSKILINKVHRGIVKLLRPYLFGGKERNSDFPWYI